MRILPAPFSCSIVAYIACCGHTPCLHAAASVVLAPFPGPIQKLERGLVALLLHIFRRHQYQVSAKPCANMILHVRQSVTNTKRTTQIVIELNSSLETAVSSSLSFVSKCCHVCGRSLDNQNQRVLFTHTDHRGKLPNRISALGGVPINQCNVKQLLSRAPR